MIDGAPENIIWCYSMYQPAYDEMLKTIPNIMFVEGVPGDLETLMNASKKRRNASPRPEAVRWLRL